jgi:ubiquinone/menaquinone biosynthesis C-methylase UbiE
MDTPAVTSLLGAKPGLSGQSAIVVPDDDVAVSARRAAEQAGALVNISVHALDALPFERHSFDLVVAHNRNGQLTALDDTQRSRAILECHRVLRPGGRIVVLDKGTPSGVKAIFHSREPGSPEPTIKMLQEAGFRPVRALGDRDGYSFVEGLKAGSDD